MNDDEILDREYKNKKTPKWMKISNWVIALMCGISFMFLVFQWPYRYIILTATLGVFFGYALSLVFMGKRPIWFIFISIINFFNFREYLVDNGLYICIISGAITFVLFLILSEKYKEPSHTSLNDEF